MCIVDDHCQALEGSRPLSRTLWGTQLVTNRCCHPQLFHSSTEPGGAWACPWEAYVRVDVNNRWQWWVIALSWVLCQRMCHLMGDVGVTLWVHILFSGMVEIDQLLCTFMCININVFLQMEREAGAVGCIVVVAYLCQEVVSYNYICDIKH